MDEWQLNGHFILPAFSHHRQGLGQSGKRWHFWGCWISDTCSEGRHACLVSKGITGMSFKGTMNLINTKPNTKVFIGSPGILRSVNFSFFSLLCVSFSCFSSSGSLFISPFLMSNKSGVWFIKSSAFSKWILRMLLQN